MTTITIRNDDKNDYYTQRNNKVRPKITCAPTSAIMAMRNAGYGKDLDKIVPKGTQEEDYLTNFIHTDHRVLEFWSQNPVAWIRNAYKGYTDFVAGAPNRTEMNTTFGNEIHEVLAFAINTLLGDNVDTFSYQMPMAEILFNMVRGGGVITSGSWPTTGANIAHVVALVGFTTSQKNIKEVMSAAEIDPLLVTEFIVDDPWGDYRKLYKSAKGNDVIVPRADFIKIINEPGVVDSKRAHLIAPKVVREPEIILAEEDILTSQIKVNNFEEEASSETASEETQKSIHFNPFREVFKRKVK